MHGGYKIDCFIGIYNSNANSIYLMLDYLFIQFPLCFFDLEFGDWDLFL